MDPATVMSIATPVLTLAAAWGGVKASLNGTRQRVNRLEAQGDRIETAVSDVRVTVARVEERTRHIPDESAALQ